MECSAKAFMERVCSVNPEAVSGFRVSGPVLLSYAEITQSNWTNCVFDSAIELRNCRMKASGSSKLPGVSNQPVFVPLDLSGCKILGSLTISECSIDVDHYLELLRPTSGFHPKGVSHPRIIGIQVQLDSVSVDGDMRLAGLKLSHVVEGDDRFKKVISAQRSRIGGEFLADNFENEPLSLELEGFSSERGLTLRGYLAQVRLPHSQINANLRIELSPSIPERSYVQGEVVSTDINLENARISGEASITSHHETSDVTQFAEGDRESSPRPTHAEDMLMPVKLRARKIRVSHDFTVGRATSEYTRYDVPIRLFHSDFSSADIGGDLSLMHAEMSGTFCSEDNTHLHRCFLAKNASVEAMRLQSVKVSCPLEGIPEGDQVLLFDMSGISASRDIIIDGVLGVVGYAEGVATLDVTGVALDQCECANLVFRNFDVLQASGERTIATDVSCRSARVREEARFGLIPKLRPEAPQERHPDTVPAVDLQESEIACLSLDEPTPSGKIALVGARISRWGTRSKKNTGDQESFSAYVRLLECTSETDVAQYVAIEHRLRDIGKSKDADQMHVHWKREERRGLRGYRKLSSFLHDAFLAYGTQVWRPAIAIFFVFLASVPLTFVNYESWFGPASGALHAEQGNRFKPGDSPCDGKDFSSLQCRIQLIDSMSLSARHLIPIVDLQLATDIKPIPNRGAEAWITILRLLGYLLWPIFLTGLVANLLPQRGGK